MTGSRDTSMKIWTEKENKSVYELKRTIQGHSDFVSALAVCQATEMSGIQLVSGSRDCTVKAWRLYDDDEKEKENGESGNIPLAVMEGHKYQVTGLACAPLTGEIVSASLDTTLRVWKDGCCAMILEGHDGPVLCVTRVEDSSVFVSGSGDSTLRVWDLSIDGGTCVSTMQGHTDTVRSVACVPGIGIISGSHDTTARVWTIDGCCVQELEGHTALIYSVSVNSEGTLVASGSEDTTVRIWNLDGTCLQVIEHPGCVWGTCFLPNGDLVTACSDGVARVWSQDGSRQAPADVCATFESSLEEYKGSLKAGSDGNNGQNVPLQPKSALDTQGTQDGQTLLIDEGDTGMVYSWNQNEMRWEKVGEILSGPGAEAGQAPSTDFVFDVDIADGMPPLRLAANAGDNAYAIADSFIIENNLPTSYREQIVEFLVKNTNGQVGTDTSMQVADPYTGAQAYVPTSNQAPQSSCPVENADPYTGVRAKSKLPVQTYAFFSSALPIVTVKKKLEEFNAIIMSSQEKGTSELQLDEKDWKDLESLFAYASGSISPASPPSVFHKLLKWPLEYIFPILDICRALLCTESGAQMLRESVESLSSNPSQNSLGDVLTRVLTSEGNNTSKTAALRCIANMFQPRTVSHMADNMQYVLTLLSSCSKSSVKGIQNAFSSILLNATVLQFKSVKENDVVVRAISGLLTDFLKTSDSEVSPAARTTALLALGTLVHQSSPVRTEIAGIERTNPFLRMISEKSGEEALVIAGEIISML